MSVATLPVDDTIAAALGAVALKGRLLRGIVVAFVENRVQVLESAAELGLVLAVRLAHRADHARRDATPQNIGYLALPVPAHERFENRQKWIIGGKVMDELN